MDDELEDAFNAWEAARNWRRTLEDRGKELYKQWSQSQDDVLRAGDVEDTARARYIRLRDGERE